MSSRFLGLLRRVYISFGEFAMLLRSAVRNMRSSSEARHSKLQYVSLLSWLGVGGFVFAILHFAIAQGRPLLQYPSTDLVHIVFLPLLSIWIWLAGSLLFYSVDYFINSNPNRKNAELSALSIWLVWFTMPIIDIPHLFGVPFVYIFGVGAHLSWLCAFTLIPIIAYKQFKRIAPRNSKLLLLALGLLSVCLPIVGRYGVENLPLYISWMSFGGGTLASYNEAAFFVGPTLFAGVFVAYKFLMTGSHDWRKLIRQTTRTSVAFSVIAAVLVLNLGAILDSSFLPRWLGQKEQSSRAEDEVGEYGEGKSEYTHSHTWTSADYEAATYTTTANTNSEAVLKEYAGVVDLDFDPAKATITAVRCKVNFTAATADYEPTDATPRARCDILPNGGAYQLGTYQGPLTTSAGLRTFTWTNPAWGSTLSQLDNSVRVFGQVAWNGNANTPLTDRIAFDAVTVEIDYEANLTQTNYRWYNNNNGVQPGSARAAENTATTLVESAEVIRLRAAMQVETGRMDASTEPFKLQYGARIGGVCGDDESWSDVGGIGSGAAWRGYDNASPANGVQITGSLLGTLNYGRQSYQEDNTAYNNKVELNAGGTNRGEWDWVLQANTAAPSTTYCFRMVESGGTLLKTYSVYPQATTAPALVVNHSAYRWFENNDALNAGSALAAQNTAAYASYEDAPFRLRMLLDAEGQSIPTAATAKLQYALRSGTCDTSFSGESYVDVQAGSGAIRYYNATPADAATPSSNAGDPTYSGHTKVYQHYVESNPFSVRQKIPVNQSGLWDFSLIDASAVPGETYCFRIVDSGGSPLGTYTVVPQITTVGFFGVDVVDSGGSSIPNPIVAMSLGVTQFTCQTTTGILGAPTQKIRASNGQPNAGWTLSVAATAGSSALWSAGTPLYDFNDPSGSPAGCGAGLDGDVYAGQLTINPSTASITPQSGCVSTGITKGSQAGFNESTVDSIVIASGSGGVQLFCYYDFQNIGFSQTIPGSQPSGTYSLDLTMTMIAN